MMQWFIYICAGYIQGDMFFPVASVLFQKGPVGESLVSHRFLETASAAEEHPRFPSFVVKGVSNYTYRQERYLKQSGIPISKAAA